MWTLSSGRSQNRHDSRTGTTPADQATAAGIARYSQPAADTTGRITTGNSCHSRAPCSSAGIPCRKKDQSVRKLQEEQTRHQQQFIQQEKENAELRADNRSLQEKLRTFDEELTRKFEVLSQQILDDKSKNSPSSTKNRYPG